ncbi:MAG TPA: helix-turn-helix domain-containing protein [Candidatus Saccharimonadales bacterium]|nr:helix-turn-helix domain-containing protein [Candidatus Saccharimonadales bacterium]
MSGKFRVIDPAVKADAIAEVKNQGMPVSQAATKYGVDPRTIYGWLKKEVVGGDKNLILENNRLKKENEQLYNLLGRATAELKRPKG